MYSGSPPVHIFTGFVLRNWEAATGDVTAGKRCEVELIDVW